MLRSYKIDADMSPRNTFKNNTPDPSGQISDIPAAVSKAFVENGASDDVHQNKRLGALAKS